MHLKRWITGLVLVPPLVFLVVAGGLPFTLLVIGVCLITLSEFYRILFVKEGGLKANGVLVASGMAVSALIIWAANQYTTDAMVCALMLNFPIMALILFYRFEPGSLVMVSAGRQILGLVYVALPLAMAVMMRRSFNGSSWLFLVLAVVFAGDIGALYAGTYFGRHKLCPRVSPGKTIEGSIGGLLANVAVGVAFKLALFPLMDWSIGIIFFVCLGVAGQVGDLFESAFKRSADVKDSGGLLPGHGGLLDRIDALLFALPVAYFFMKFMLWI